MPHRLGLRRALGFDHFGQRSFHCLAGSFALRSGYPQEISRETKSQGIDLRVPCFIVEVSRELYIFRNGTEPIPVPETLDTLDTLDSMWSCEHLMNITTCD